MLRIKAIKIPGYTPGEYVTVPENVALTYVSNGQAEAVDWDPEALSSRTQPVNRMLDTGAGLGPTKTKDRDE